MDYSQKISERQWNLPDKSKRNAISAAAALQKIPMETVL